MDQSVNVVKTTHAEKPEKFKGVDFKRWQQKMLIYLTTLNLAHVISQEKPVAEELPITKDTLNAIDAWTHSEFLGRNYILNGLDDTSHIHGSRSPLLSLLIQILISSRNIHTDIPSNNILPAIRASLSPNRLTQ